MEGGAVGIECPPPPPNQWPHPHITVGGMGLTLSWATRRGQGEEAGLRELRFMFSLCPTSLDDLG